MISSSQRFCGCSGECLEGFDIFTVSDWNGTEGSAHSMLHSMAGKGTAANQLCLEPPPRYKEGAMRTIEELINVLTGQCLWNSHGSCVLPKLPKASCPTGPVSEMWHLSDLGRQIPFIAVLRGQGLALHLWAV